MRLAISILLIIVLFFVTCKEEKPVLKDTAATLNYENRFFTLDFEQGDIGMQELKEHFFTNFPHNDPTQGDVVYDQSQWNQDDLIEIKKNDGLYAFTRYRDDDKAYDSYRLTSKAYFNLNEETRKILFVFKGRLPSEKGMWPAWWLNGSKEKTWTYTNNLPALNDEQLKIYSGKGPSHITSSSVNNTDWPGAGEIDIIENINGNKEIHNTIHTCPQMCNSEWNSDGEIINCANARSDDPNPGCSGQTYEVEKPEGTFACVWEEKMISFYYWPDGSGLKEKGGPLDKSPDPTLWIKEALKNVVKLLESDENCQKEIHQPWQCNNCAGSSSCQFINMKMIFNLTLCGLWAGNQFDTTDNALSNCQEYILGEGIKMIDDQSMEIEYVSVKKL